ncbi:hypothetical protein [Celeribacter sp. ULVN23_4]
MQGICDSPSLPAQTCLSQWQPTLHRSFTESAIRACRSILSGQRSILRTTVRGIAQKPFAVSVTLTWIAKSGLMVMRNVSHSEVANVSAHVARGVQDLTHAVGQKARFSGYQWLLQSMPPPLIEGRQNALA